MSELFEWLGRFENSKVVALLIFFTTFCAILLYVYTGKKRSKRLESYKYIPFEEDDDQADDAKVESDERNK